MQNFSAYCSLIGIVKTVPGLPAKSENTFTAAGIVALDLSELEEPGIEAGWLHLDAAGNQAIAQIIANKLLLTAYSPKIHMLRNLKSNQVDLNARTMRLEAGTTKNGKARVVKIDGELLETIEAQWQGRMVAQFLGLSFVFHRDGENRSGITQCVG